MTPLTLPGSIPGLLLHCSPVLWRGESLWIVLGKRCNFAIIGRASEVRTVRRDELDLDLTDATGCAHAAWWLAGVVRMEVVDWCRWPLSHHDQGHGWRLSGKDGLKHRMMTNYKQSDAEALSYGQWWVPALAHLDTNDPRTIHGGSRWVDAEALRLVCLHVAGVTP